MILMADDLAESIRLDILQAFTDLRAAEEASRMRDDPAARARLRTCRATIDGILDMWNDVARSPA